MQFAAMAAADLALKRGREEEIAPAGDAPTRPPGAGYSVAVDV
jgi:hypothetical protein